MCDTWFALVATAAGLGYQVLLPQGSVPGDLALGLATGVLVLGLRTVTVPGGAVGRVSRGVAGHGGASYSLSLVHLPILVLLSATLFPTGDSRWTPTPVTLVAFAGISAATVVVGYGFAAATEFHTDRLRRWLETRSPSRVRAMRPVAAAHPPLGGI